MLMSAQINIKVVDLAVLPVRAWPACWAGSILARQCCSRYDGIDM